MVDPKNQKEMNLIIRNTYCQNWGEVYHPIREIYANQEDEIESQLGKKYDKSKLPKGETFRDNIKVQPLDSHSFKLSYGSMSEKMVYGYILYSERTKELSFINKGRIPDIAILLGGSSR
jgi:hypothetical protein